MPCTAPDGLVKGPPEPGSEVPLSAVVDAPASSPGRSTTGPHAAMPTARLTSVGRPRGAYGPRRGVTRTLAAPTRAR